MVEQSAYDFVVGYAFISTLILLMIIFVYMDSRREKHYKEFANNTRWQKNPEIASMTIDEFNKMIDFYMANKSLENVPGNVLPPIGATVKIYLNSKTDWVNHTVVGYYVTITYVRTYRINVRVVDSNGYENARELGDIVWER